jgi:hypothetical protein
MVGEAVNPELIKRRMWLDYQKASSDPTNDRIGCVHLLMPSLTGIALALLVPCEEQARQPVRD